MADEVRHTQEDIDRVLGMLEQPAPYVTPPEEGEPIEGYSEVFDPITKTWVPLEALAAAEPVDDEPNPIDVLFENDRILGDALEELRAQPVQKPVDKRARIDPDDRRVLIVVLALVLVVAAAAGVASFAGQTAMGPYTGLPPWLYFVIPLFIDLPIMVVSFLIPIFRARGESVVTSWIMLGTLTGLSSAINVVHVLGANGGTLNVNTLTGCIIMGLAPIVIMIAFEETVRLAVHTPEKE